MPPVVIPNTLRVDSIWQLNGIDTAVNVHNYISIIGNPVNQAFADQVLATYVTALNLSGLLTRISNQVQLNRVGVRWVGIPNQVRLEGTGPGAQGTAVSDALPPMVSLVCTLRTALAGRRFRGRHYQFGIAEAENTISGQATAAVQGDLQVYLATLRTTMADDGLLLGVASSLGTGSPVAPVPATEVVVGIDVRDGIWDTQRRRSIPGI